MRRLSQFAARCAAVLTLSGVWAVAVAGELTQVDIQRRIQPPLRVAAKLPDLPAWPVTSELEPEAGPVAYVFESIDLAPIPGFEGTPFNLLITLDREGRFVDVEVLRQHEPVFLSGLGIEPLLEFVRQYTGRSLLRPLTVASTYGARGSRDAAGNTIDGVAKATASVRIVNQTVLNAALVVARARLGFSAATSREPPATPRPDIVRQRGLDELIADGAVAQIHLSNAAAESLFRGTEAEGSDERALSDPQGEQLTLTIAYLNAPSIGRSLLGAEPHGTLLRALDPDQPAFWIGTRGRTALFDANFVPGTAPAGLTLTQDGLALELRDFNLPVPDPPGLGPTNASGIFTVPLAAGLDPARPMRFEFSLQRSQGMILPRVTTVPLVIDYAPPTALFARPPKPPPEWLQAWQDRWLELSVIGGALALLTAILAAPRWISISRRRLLNFRLGFLAFTLAYIGWYAQGQLSIVQVTGAIKAVAAGGSLASFLYDPISLLLIGFTVATFLVWGRGTFCGWLCPFGALQEFAVHVRERAGLKDVRVPQRLAARLAWLPAILLAVLVIAAALAPAWAERLVEVEPFKTAITVGFDRSLPFVAYAVIVLLLSAFVYKAFCRFLCPLGALMAIGGRLRRFDWLPRRRECGQPCQTCRHRCRYEAIDSSGAIRYTDCFQCLDCVGIFHDQRRCAPLILMRKRQRKQERLNQSPPA